MEVMTMTGFMSPREVSEYLGAPMQSVYAWIRRGHLPAVRLAPKAMVVPTSAVVGFVPPAERRRARR